MSAIDWVLWSGTIGYTRPMEERIAAAVNAGYQSL